MKDKKIYRVYSDEIPLCQFPDNLITSVTVISSSEEEALELAVKGIGDDFVCETKDLKVSLVSNSVESQILSYRYFEP